MSTKIEWTERTWNPVHGCTKISPGCHNCYAERMAKRLQAMGNASYRNGFDVTMRSEKLEEPLKWTRPSMIFVCSMGDLFHESVSDEFLFDVFRTMAKKPQHTFQILTKRPERMRQFITNRSFFGPRNMTDSWKNVWLGVTSENQEQADKRIPILLDTPAAVRFVSVEPMLERVDLGHFLCRTWRTGYTMGRYLDWVICGGETGPNARPMHPRWARDLRDQCAAADVPFFFKKIDGRAVVPDDLMVRQMPGERP